MQKATGLDKQIMVTIYKNTIVYRSRASVEKYPIVNNPLITNTSPNEGRGASSWANQKLSGRTASQVICLHGPDL